MKTMNYESSKWSRDAIDDVPVDEEELARKRKRRRIIVAVVLVLLLAVAAYMFLGGGGGEKGADKGAGKAGQQLPAVTVIVPGRQDVPSVISATGSPPPERPMSRGGPPPRGP